MAGIFDIFRAPPAPAPAPAPATPQQGTSQQQTGTESQSQQQDTSTQQQQSPLDTYKDLFDTSKDSTAQPTLDPSAPLFNVDNSKLQEAVSKLDVSKSIPPEVFAKISQGGQEAQQAFAVAMNKVAQEAFGRSIAVAAQMVNAANQKILESVDTHIPGQMSKLLLQNHVLDDNPAFKHPAVQPLISAVSEQLRAKNPGKSAAEIKQMTISYIKGLTSLVQDGEGADEVGTRNSMNGTGKRKAAPSTDWDSWMSS